MRAVDIILTGDVIQFNYYGQVQTSICFGHYRKQSLVVVVYDHKEDKYHWETIKRNQLIRRLK